MAEVPVPTVAPTTAPISNKSTGIEVKVTDFWLEKQGKFGGLMGKTHVYYQLLCATNNAKSLGCKNAEARRRNDVSDGVDVHFTIGKSYEEIAQLRKDLDLHFSGSFFPPLPRIAVSGSSELEHRKQARSCQDIINKLFNICCEQKKVAFGKVFLNFFGFRTDPKTIERLISDKKEAVAELEEEDDDIFESRAREDKEKKQQKEVMFASETTPKEESLFENDDDEVTGQSTSKVGLFNDDQLFPTEDEQKVATTDPISEDEDDDEIDLSDLMSKLKAVPKIEKTKKTRTANSNKVEKVETSDGGGEDIDEENLLEYINQNLNLDDVSLDFD